MATDGPYRHGGVPAAPVDPEAWRTRFVCIACFGSSSSRPGVCARDGAPLSDLRRMDVEWAVRSFAQARLETQLSRRARLGMVCGIGFPWVGLLLMRLSGCHLVASSIGRDGRPHAAGHFELALLIIAGWLVAVILFGDKPANVPSGFRPSSAPLEEVLNWLAL